MCVREWTKGANVVLVNGYMEVLYVFLNGNMVIECVLVNGHMEVLCMLVNGHMEVMWCWRMDIWRYCVCC